VGEGVEKKTRQISLFVVPSKLKSFVFILPHECTLLFYLKWNKNTNCFCFKTTRILNFPDGDCGKVERMKYIHIVESNALQNNRAVRVYIVIGVLGFRSVRFYSEISSSEIINNNNYLITKKKSILSISRFIYIFVVIFLFSCFLCNKKG
jgi:hypothetical protein